MRNNERMLFMALALPLISSFAVAADKIQKKWWIEHGASEITYPLTADGSQGKALFRPAQAKEPRPLLVALHSWESDHLRPYPEQLAYCVKHDWTFIEPEFRGRNNRPESMCSELVVRDILDAVAYAKREASVDSSRIYLFGFSGGGMAALLMAGRHPEIWAGVSVWCPLIDIREWYSYRITVEKDSNGYAPQIIKAAGGDPLKDTSAAAECAKRSPVNCLEKARGVKISICVGIQDAAIPNSHSLKAFNILANPGDRFTDKEIESLRDAKDVPAGMRQELKEPGCGRIYFRRESNNVSITAVEGGHVFRPGSMDWLARQRLNMSSDDL